MGRVRSFPASRSPGAFAPGPCSTGARRRAGRGGRGADRGRDRGMVLLRGDTEDCPARGARAIWLVIASTMDNTLPQPPCQRFPTCWRRTQRRSSSVARPLPVPGPLFTFPLANTIVQPSTSARKIVHSVTDSVTDKEDGVGQAGQDAARAGRRSARRGAAAWIGHARWWWPRNVRLHGTNSAICS